MLSKNSTGIICSLVFGITCLSMAEPQKSSASSKGSDRKSKSSSVEQDLSRLLKKAKGGNPAVQCELAQYYSEHKDPKAALEWYLRAADKGNAGGQNGVARIYLNGEGVAKDYKKAFEFFSKAAAQGHARAERNLGIMYWAGLGVPKDYQKAFELFSKAAEQNYAPAQAALADMYNRGAGVGKDANQAAQWAQKAAEQGNPDGQVMIATLYLEGSGVSKDANKAIDFLTKAASGGSAQADLLLGKIYHNGSSVQKNDKLALEYWTKAAEQGNAGAESLLAYAYCTGDGAKQDINKAVEYWTRAANQGFAEAEYNLGWIKQEGIVAEKDSKAAFAWYTKAAEQNYAKALLTLGNMYFAGEASEKDEKKAFECWSKAAAQGDAAGQNQLGVAYYEGNGTTKDPDKAIEYFKKAADQNYAAAEYNLGAIYQNGIEVKKDLNAALACYRKAANHGSAIAMLNLGDLANAGQGLAKDAKAAISWWTKSAALGNASAQNTLGWAYSTGYGVKKDFAKALRCWSEAAANGSAAAEFNLSEMYRIGDGVSLSSTKAAEWLQKAADHGDLRSQIALGWDYFFGGLHMQERQLAFNYFSKAASGGSPEGQSALAKYYLWQDDPKSRTLAFEYFKKAAEQGYMPAERELAIAYLNGGGVARDFSKAEKCCVKAVKDGAPKEILETARRYKDASIRIPKLKQEIANLEKRVGNESTLVIPPLVELASLIDYGVDLKTDSQAIYERALKLAELDKSQRFAKQELLVYTVLARNYLEQERFAESMSLAARALSLQNVPGIDQHLIDQARKEIAYRCYKRGNYKQAIALLEKIDCSAASEQSAAWLVILGRCYLAQKEFDKAKDVFARALGRTEDASHRGSDAGGTPALPELGADGRFCGSCLETIFEAIADSYLSINRVSDAEKLITSQFNSGNSMPGRRALAELYAKTNHFEQAESILLALLRDCEKRTGALSADSIQIRKELEDLYLNQSKQERAELLYKSLTQKFEAEDQSTDDRANALAHLARYYTDRHQINQARQAMERSNLLLQAAPPLAADRAEIVSRNLAILNAEFLIRAEGRVPTEGQGTGQAAIEALKANAIIYAKRGDLEKSEGQLLSLISTLEKNQAKQKDSKEPYKARELYNAIYCLGQMYVLDKKYAAALPYFEKLYKEPISPELKDAAKEISFETGIRRSCRPLSFVYYKQGFSNKARNQSSHFENAEQLYGNNIAATESAHETVQWTDLNELAWLRLQNGKAKLALASLEKAINQADSMRIFAQGNQTFVQEKLGLDSEAAMKEILQYLADYADCHDALAPQIIMNEIYSNPSTLPGEIYKTSAGETRIEPFIRLGDSAPRLSEYKGWLEIIDSCNYGSPSDLEFINWTFSAKSLDKNWLRVLAEARLADLYANHKKYEKAKSQYKHALSLALKTAASNNDVVTVIREHQAELLKKERSKSIAEH